MSHNKDTIDDLSQNISYLIQEIDHVYQVVLYIPNNSISHASMKVIVNHLFQKYPFGDVTCFIGFNSDQNKTKITLITNDNKLNLPKIVMNNSNNLNSEIIYDGIVNILPYKVIDSPVLLSLLTNYTKGTLLWGTQNHRYTLFKVDIENQDWMDDNYLDLIKRNNIDSSFIVFQKDNIGIEFGDNDEIVSLNEYNIVYNEKTENNPEKQLQTLIFTRDKILSFTSHLEFSELFSQANKNKYRIETIDNDDLFNYRSDSDDEQN